MGTKRLLLAITAGMFAVGTLAVPASALPGETPMTLQLTPGVLSITVPSATASPWDATITVKSGLVERTAQATITFPDEGAAAPVATTAAADTERTWLLPAAIGLLALLLALAVFLVLRSRRRRRPSAGTDDATDGYGDGDPSEPARREPVLTS